MFTRNFRLSALFAVAGTLAFAGHASTADFVSRRAPVPPAECKAYVGYDRDQVMPGYILPTSAGPRTCIPFSSARFQPPAGYKGDYYVDEFTDVKLRAAWEDCKKDDACHKRVFDQVMKRHPPNKEHDLTDEHGRYLLGKIDEKGGDTDLTTVRRPAFFAQKPWEETIAADDPQTYVVEFTAPPEAYEKLHMGAKDDIKLRGWYIRGGGIDNGHGGKKRALIILSGGGGDRIAGIDDVRDPVYVIDPKTGLTIPDDDWPNATTGAKSMRKWREMYHILHQAGFDVLAMDRRGVGISGGYSDTNTLQQGHDVLDVTAALRTGKGMRALSPDGKLTTGAAAANAVNGGDAKAGLPVFFMGSSRGTMASGFAMTINFDKDCSYDLPKITCGPARHDPHVAGAILLADYSSGVGYLPAETAPKDDGRGPGKDRDLFIGGIEVEHNIVFFPSSAILAGMHTWPSAFFARGLWCYADALEGEMDSYSRVNGLKELIVVRGPHAYTIWPQSEEQRVQQRIIAYVSAVILKQPTIPGGRPWTNMKELVATTGDAWEPSTHATQVP